MSRIRIVGGTITKTSKGVTTIEVLDGHFKSSAAKENRWMGDKNGNTYHEYKASEKKEEKPKEITFSGWWSPDYEGQKNLETDNRGPKSSLDKTVYFQLNVSKDIPLGTNITFQLWDKDTGMFIDWLVPDDDKLDGKKVYRNAIVREVDGKHRITIELYLNPKWNSDLLSDKGYFKDGCLDFYWTWKYNNSDWTSNTNVLSVYPSETTLFIKPAMSKKDYGLPEIYSKKGAIVLYALSKLPDGKIQKFAMIKLRTITTFSLMSDINKFKREIYEEAINLNTNRLESASYFVEEGAHFFKTNKNVSRIFIDEKIIDVPIEGRGLLAVKNFKAKTVKFSKVAAEYYAHYELLKEMKEMIPELSSNEKFNMPALSTFVGFVPQLEVFAFGVEVIGWMVKDSFREVDQIVDESMWADWQNAKCKGLKYAQDFIRSSWAIENGFDSTYVGQSILDKLLKGKIKTLTDLRKLNSENYLENKIYTVMHYRVNEDTSGKKNDIIDSIFINEEPYI